LDIIVLLGRILLASMFLFSGMMGHLGQRKALAQYASSKGVPIANALVPISGLLIIAGGLMVLLGAWGDLGALLLVVFLVPTALYMHAFWKIEDPNEKANQMTHFMKNMVMAGGALLAFVLFAYSGGDLGLTLTEPLFDFP
jgi:putative oxidoreductase